MWIKFFIEQQEFDADEWSNDGMCVQFGDLEPVSGSDVPFQVVYERIDSMAGCPGEPTYVIYSANPDERVDISGIQGPWCLVNEPIHDE
jgi:hypothetical protein